MLRSLRSRLLIYFMLANLVVIVFLPMNSISYEMPWWDNDWSFSQEINIPIDTNTEIAKYQPVDIGIEFDNTCWAKNITEHSIRVCCWDGASFHELESQIYNLEQIDEKYITACCLVFLIPEFANGKERYFVYYDDSEKSSPDYMNHVDIEESYYNYEPIPGYPLESHFYKVIDDDCITYAVSQDGQFMGYNTGQHVTKMLDETTEVLPKNGDLFAAFDFKYCYGEGLFGYSSTSQRLVSKEIRVDGNLMLEFGIVSRSKFDDLQTTATYKYYHCPASNTRIHTHVTHETLKEVKVYSEANTDGTYASLQSGGVKSNSIEDLNIGQILPYIHFYNELGSITKYSLDLDPEYIPEDPDIRILNVQDDVDLGKYPWISFDEGDAGLSHSVIFDSNNVVVSGTDERDGLQLNAFEMDYPHLPGLENNIATIQICRNSYEIGDSHDLIIPEDFVVEFDAEFFSSKTKGFNVLNEEAEIFQELVKIKPQSDGDFTEASNETEKHTLSVLVHFAPSVPMGSSLSALLGRNFSYISAELYKNDEYIYSGSTVRLPMKAIDDFGELNLIKKIVATFSSFDWKNMSFFKKIDFLGLEPGKYVIKIYKENPLFAQEHQYIAFATVDLKEDEKIHISCRSQRSMGVNITDQNDNGVENAEVLLQKDNFTIAKDITDKNGQVEIKAPGTSEPYMLRVLYNGFIVYEEPVKLGALGQLFSLEKSISIERYNFYLEVSDTWQLSPEIELNPLIVNEEDESIVIHAEKLSNGIYLFTNVTPATYQLVLKYKSFTLEKTVEITGNEGLKLEFPAEFNIDLKILDSRGIPYAGAKITLTRSDKKLELQNEESEASVSIPPGAYHVKIYNEGNLVGSRNIDVSGEGKFDLITKHEPLFPTLMVAVSILLIILSLILSYVKKEKMYFLTMLPISLVIIAVVSSWWTIHGSLQQLETSTHMFILPTELVTMTDTLNIIAGERAFLPNLFIDAIYIVLILSAVGCILIASSCFFKKTNKKRLYLLSITFASLVLIGSLVIFTVGMNTLCESGVGSFIGEGNLDISIAGESDSASVLCTWGPGIGFHLYTILVILLSVNVIYTLSKSKKIWGINHEKKKEKHEKK